MKRFILFIFMLCVVTLTQAQTYEFNLTATAVKKYQGYSKGSTIKIKGLEHNVSTDPFYSSQVVLKDSYDMLLEDGSKIPLTTRIDKALKFDLKSIDDLWNAAILQDVIPMLITKGTQVDIRSDAELNALEYVLAIKNNGLEFDDPYLLNYLYALVSKISPSSLIDGRPGGINLIVEDNPDVNAGTYPNGTIVVNTGLLSVLHTEDELVAVLAHEVAHFVLDHHMQNINAEIQRQRRAEIGAAIATIFAAAAEGAAAYYSNGYYIPGAVTAATAIGATAIAKQAVIDLGMEYSQKQEFEADEYALQVLDFLGYDHHALASALTRLEEVQLIERSKAMYFSSTTHPALVERIEKAGGANLKRDVNFERKISFAITNSAITKYYYRRFREAAKAVSQNIENNVATADDYLIKANCLLALSDTEASNIEVLELIKKAKKLQPNNINIYKAEILANLRLNRAQQAIEELQEYKSYLNETSKELPSILNQSMWKSRYDFILNEHIWVDKMLIKLSGMYKQ